jgi:hypothetical protein
MKSGISTLETELGMLLRYGALLHTGLFHDRQNDSTHHDTTCSTSYCLVTIQFQFIQFHQIHYKS